VLSFLRFSWLSSVFAGSYGQLWAIFGWVRFLVAGVGFLRHLWAISGICGFCLDFVPPAREMVPFSLG